MKLNVLFSVASINVVGSNSYVDRTCKSTILITTGSVADNDFKILKEIIINATDTMLDQATDLGLSADPPQRI